MDFNGDVRRRGGWWRVWTAALGVVVTGLTVEVTASDYPNWSRFESSAEAKSYQESLQSRGDPFDDKSRRVLVEQGLPQLGLEANAADLPRLRARIRQVLLTDIKNPTAAAAANKAALDWLLERVQDEAMSPAGRMNAVLLAGELRDADLLPAVAADTGLLKLVIDPTALPELRVAALRGLELRIAAGKASDTPEERRRAVAELVVKLLPILTEAATPANAAAVEWLQMQLLAMLSNGIEILEAKSVQAASEAATSILFDEGRRPDLRVRAATFLGQSATAGAKVDAVKAVDVIEKAAITMLDDDRLAAVRRRTEREYLTLAGGGLNAGMMAGPVEQPMDGFGMPTAAVAEPSDLSEAACRRSAWRLVALATAIDGGGSRRPRDAAAPKGLSALCGDDAASAVQLASTLRDAGLAVQEDLHERSVLKALSMLRPEEKPAEPERPVGPTPFSPFPVNVASGGEARPATQASPQPGLPTGGVPAVADPFGQ
jgi:hypothetical protein